ncbi:nucleotidyltransferase family protein [Bacillus litorisediminis]|uniref:hypothetical protein n=1 Tax=Bacillus litorisediminis TaxID=2922713 RepID=UPI001FB02FF4|nr:hypothetical protein [Bacillus litorisediminis]
MIDPSHILISTLDGINQLKEKNRELSVLLDNLSTFGNLVLVGGAIRDYSYNKTPRDLDIIIESKYSDFDEILNCFNTRKNRFGGYKIFLDELEIDLWSFSKNWAFQNKLLDPKFENITKGSFYNFDALAININTKEIDVSVFIDSLRENELDITLDEEYIELNPTPEINIMRACYINKYWGLELSNKVLKYIKNWVDKINDPVELLTRAEIKHYGKKRINEEDYLKILTGT